MFRLQPAGYRPTGHECQLRKNSMHRPSRRLQPIGGIAEIHVEVILGTDGEDRPPLQTSEPYLAAKIARPLGH
jgi:hypothetical protein